MAPFSNLNTQLAFSLLENKGVFAVLLGSGVSRAAQIPTGWEITLDLIRRVAAAQGVGEQPDWAAWYRKKAEQDPSYSVLLEELASSPEERRSILHSYIEPNEEDRIEKRKVPTEAHHALADLVAAGYVRLIVTTNFDRLMENALREKGIEPTVVASVDALTGAEPLTHSACYILKLHGDYKDARILNTGRRAHLVSGTIRYPTRPHFRRAWSYRLRLVSRLGSRFKGRLPSGAQSSLFDLLGGARRTRRWSKGTDQPP